MAAAASPAHLQRGVAGAQPRTCLAVGAITCCLLVRHELVASLLGVWGLAAIEIEMLACGKGCPVVAATCKVVAVAGVSFCARPLLWRAACYR